MFLHKIFEYVEVARQYIQTQEGIGGSPQYDTKSCTFEPKNVAGLGLPENWNGYSIVRMPLESDVLTVAEVTELKKKREELLSEYNKINKMLGI